MSGSTGTEDAGAVCIVIKIRSTSNELEMKPGSFFAQCVSP